MLLECAICHGHLTDVKKGTPCGYCVADSRRTEQESCITNMEVSLSVAARGALGSERIGIQNQQDFYVFSLF